MIIQISCTNTALVVGYRCYAKTTEELDRNPGDRCMYFTCDRVWAGELWSCWRLGMDTFGLIVDERCACGQQAGL